MLLALAPVALFGPCGHDEEAERSAPHAEEGPEQLGARVIDVSDGDTITVRLTDGSVETVRYIGIDTPESVDPDEPVQCYAHRAAAFNRRLVAGREVRLRFDAERRDVYGRLLAYVYLGRRLVNAELVRRGFARTLRIAPNDSIAPLFARLAAAAARVGPWPMGTLLI